MSTRHDTEEAASRTIHTQQLSIYVQLPGSPDDARLTGEKVKRPALQWTAPKTALIELIYGLQAAGACNNGAADIKQITSFFESVFGLELGNVYNVFQEMRLRKKNRTVFLDNLRDRVVQRMDEADER